MILSALGKLHQTAEIRLTVVLFSFTTSFLHTRWWAKFIAQVNRDKCFPIPTFMHEKM